jgi:hypothetical protein
MGTPGQTVGAGSDGFWTAKAGNLLAHQTKRHTSYIGWSLASRTVLPHTLGQQESIPSPLSYFASHHHDLKRTSLS